MSIRVIKNIFWYGESVHSNEARETISAFPAVIKAASLVVGVSVVFLLFPNHAAHSS